jgi:hypothetical protein
MTEASRIFVRAAVATAIITVMLAMLLAGTAP